jgi:hypothetical protein
MPKVDEKAKPMPRGREVVVHLSAVFIRKE